MELRNNINIKNIECKVLNGRKINTKVVLEIDIYIYSNEEINILKEIKIVNQDRSEINYLLTNIYIFALWS